jgi:hypothetical protein
MTTRIETIVARPTDTAAHRAAMAMCMCMCTTMQTVGEMAET